MFERAAKRLRYEVLRRLNRARPRSGYRFAHTVIGDKRRVVLHHNGRERILNLREGTSDFPLFLQMFEDPQYDIRKFSRHQDVERRYADILKAGKRPLVVDAGANNGLSSLYFRDQYPESAIVALEPEPGNFGELRQLMGDDPLCLCVQAALADFDGHVQVVDPGLTECGFRTEQSEKGVPAYRLDTVIGMTPWPVEPFILKVDIEGFERGLFEDSTAFDAFYLAYIELHDWLLPRQRTAQSFLKASAQLDRDFLLHGENVVSIKND